MKQCYPKVPYILFLFLLAFAAPKQTLAQCECANGTSPLQLVESYTTYFPNNLPTGISVPQFAPTMGTLMCVNARVYLTSTVRFRLENNATIPVNYTIRYVRFDTLYGPGIPEVTGLVMKNYGPYPLAATDGVPGSGPDIVTTPRDTVYNQVLYQGSTTDVVHYLGTGDVTFYYSSGVPTYAVGNDHYTLEVTPLNSLRFELTYTYCENISMNSDIKTFNVALTDKKNVSLDWTTESQSKNNIYEIEVSENGQSFKNTGSTGPKSIDGITAKYMYKYSPDKPVNGKLYFRVKQAGSSKYSAIKSVTLNENPVERIAIYPNPAIRNLTLDFSSPVSGEYQIQLTNQVGQLVYFNRVRMNNSSNVQLVLNDQPAPGIYYLKATQVGTKQSFTGKILFIK